MAIPMTELMLRIKTGETTSSVQPEYPAPPQTGTTKDQTAAQPKSSGPTTATLEIKPTAGAGKAIPVVMTDQVKVVPTETTSAQPAVSPQAPAKVESTQLQVQPTGSAQMEQMTQAVKETATDEGSALTTEQALQQPASAVVAGQVSQTEIKASENTAKAEIVPGDQQVTVESTDTVTASTGTDSGQDTPDSQAEQLTQNSVQMMENYSKQAKAAENSSAAAPEAEQEVPAAPITAASGSSHPLDEGSFKVNTERAATPSQAQDIRQQVVRQLSTSLDGKIGQEKVVLHLNPEKLGQVEIQFVAKGNDLNIVISAQSGEAEKAIKEGIRELASGISDKSTRWQQVDIKVENRGQDADKNDTRNDERRDQSRQEQSASHHQEHQHRRPDGRPDWASLRGEG
jgi:hypothetical protein